MVVHEVHRPVTFVLQLLHLLHDGAGAARPPLPLVENRDVAKDTRPRTSPGRLHRREAVQGEDRRDVQGHRLHEVEGQAGPVRERPLVQVSLGDPVGVVLELAVLLPGDARDGLGVIEPLEQVKDELFAVAATDEVNLWNLKLDELCVQRRKDSAEGDLDVGISGPDLREPESWRKGSSWSTGSSSRRDAA